MRGCFLQPFEIDPLRAPLRNSRIFIKLCRQILHVSGFCRRLREHPLHIHHGNVRVCVVVVRLRQRRRKRDLLPVGRERRVAIGPVQCDDLANRIVLRQFRQINILVSSERQHRIVRRCKRDALPIRRPRESVHIQARVPRDLPRLYRRPLRRLWGLRVAHIRHPQLVLPKILLVDLIVAVFFLPLFLALAFRARRRKRNSLSIFRPVKSSDIRLLLRQLPPFSALRRNHPNLPRRRLPFPLFFLVFSFLLLASRRHNRATFPLGDKRQPPPVRRPFRRIARFIHWSYPIPPHPTGTRPFSQTVLSLLLPGGHPPLRLNQYIRGVRPPIPEVQPHSPIRKQADRCGNRARCQVPPFGQHDSIARPAQASVKHQVVPLQAVTSDRRIRLRNPQPYRLPLLHRRKPHHHHLRRGRHHFPRFDLRQHQLFSAHDLRLKLFTRIQHVC